MEIECVFLMDNRFPCKEYEVDKKMFLYRIVEGATGNIFSMGENCADLSVANGKGTETLREEPATLSHFPNVRLLVCNERRYWHSPLRASVMGSWRNSVLHGLL
jgi:hypothetical protein